MKFLDLFNYYDFDIKFIFIILELKKAMILCSTYFGGGPYCLPHLKMVI